MDIIFQGTILLFCIFCSAFFSCSETALFSLSKSKLQVLAKKDKKNGALLSEHLSRAPNLLISILIGNIFVNIFATSITERIATSIAPDYGLEIAIVSMSVIIILFGEVTPKIIAVNYSQRVSLAVIPFISKLYKFVTPFRIVLFNLSNYIISRLSKFMLSGKLPSSNEEIRAMLFDSHRAGILLEHEKNMIDGIIKLHSLNAKDILTPRSEMVFFEVSESLEKIFTAMRKGKYSRIPIYEQKMDNIIGVLYLKDILFLKNKNVCIKSLLRKPFFVPETKSADRLFHEMRKINVHLAIVVDEYGGVEGVLSMEDILEEIFGDILDKKDALLSMKRINAKSMRISGRLTIDDFNEVFESNLKDELNVTIAGYLLRKIGRIPKKGEFFLYGGFEFFAAAVKKNRIEEIIVTKLRK
ncbi:HlyC/CorC family transporter [bacterium]|nr:HlyC/CorC family transporter [bacterium]